MSINVLDEKVGALGALLRQQAVKDKGAKEAQELVDSWRESDERLEKKRRRENAAGWFSYYSHLAQVLHERAAHYERKAEALCSE
jgi:hypothetical protein